jgi:hypothetical protein
MLNLRCMQDRHVYRHTYLLGGGGRYRLYARA